MHSILSYLYNSFYIQSNQPFPISITNIINTPFQYHQYYNLFQTYTYKLYFPQTVTLCIHQIYILYLYHLFQCKIFIVSFFLSIGSSMIRSHWNRTSAIYTNTPSHLLSMQTYKYIIHQLYSILS